MKKVVGYQICQGIWNPRGENYSWVVAAEYDSKKPGYAEGGFLMDCFLLGVDPADPLLSHAKVTAQAKEARRNYQGPPLALCVVTTQVLEEVRPNDVAALAS